MNFGTWRQSSGEQAGAPGWQEHGLPEQAVNRTSSRNNELRAVMETNTFFQPLCTKLLLLLLLSHHSFGKKAVQQNKVSAQSCTLSELTRYQTENYLVVNLLLLVFWDCDFLVCC